MITVKAYKTIGSQVDVTVEITADEELTINFFRDKSPLAQQFTLEKGQTLNINQEIKLRVQNALEETRVVFEVV